MEDGAKAEGGVGANDKAGIGEWETVGVGVGVPLLLIKAPRALIESSSLPVGERLWQKLCHVRDSAILARSKR